MVDADLTMSRGDHLYAHNLAKELSGHMSVTVIQVDGTQQPQTFAYKVVNVRRSDLSALEMLTREVDVSVMFDPRLHGLRRALTSRRNIISPLDSPSYHYLTRLKQSAYDPYSVLQFLRYLNLEHRAYRKFDRVVFVNAIDGEWAKSRRLARASDVLVIPNGVADEWFTVRPARTSAVVFAGVMTYRPNFDAAKRILKDIWPIVHLARPNVKLGIFGDTDGSLHRWAIERDLSHSGISIGWASDLRTTYSEFSIFICPLTSGSGVRNKVLEAMASGLAVVATSHSMSGIAGFRTGKNAITCEIDEFPRALVQVIDDPALRLKLGETARNSVRTNTWRRVSEQWEDLVFTLGR